MPGARPRRSTCLRPAALSGVAAGAPLLALMLLGAGAVRAADAAEPVAPLAQGATPQELHRAKAQAKAGLFMGRESPLARAEQAAGQLHLFDRLIPPAELVEAIDAVTAADLARVSERVLSGPRTVAVLGPKRATEAVAAFEKAL